MISVISSYGGTTPGSSTNYTGNTTSFTTNNTSYTGNSTSYTGNNSFLSGATSNSSAYNTFTRLRRNSDGESSALTKLAKTYEDRSRSGPYLHQAVGIVFHSINFRRFQIFIQEQFLEAVQESAASHTVQ